MFLLAAKTENTDIEKTGALIKKASADRWERLARMPPEAAKNAAGAYFLLFHGLKTRFGISEIPFIEYSANGKPFLTGLPEIQFNLSHTRGYAACAISDAPVGCDIEIIRECRFAQKVLSDGEFELYRQTENKDDCFIRLWTLKESYVKFTGQGINVKLQSLDFESGALKNTDCRFKSYKFEDCYISVASEKDEFPSCPEIVDMGELHDIV